MKKYINFTLIISVVSLLFFYSCTKEDTNLTLELNTENDLNLSNVELKKEMLVFT